jgi:hypothetical protein
LTKVFAALLGAATVASVSAAFIPLTNPSLEAQAYGGWQDPWTAYFDGWSGSGPVGASPVAYDGSQGLWNCWGYGWSGLFQNSSYTVQAVGETLTAGIWARTDANAGNTIYFNLQLILDGNSAAFAQPGFSPGTGWTQITTSYVTTAGDIGKTVGMSFGTDGGQYLYTGSPNYCYMDLASLTTIAPVPEPTTWAGMIFGGGLAVVYGLRTHAVRRRMRCWRGTVNEWLDAA